MWWYFFSAFFPLRSLSPSGQSAESLAKDIVKAIELMETQLQDAVEELYLEINRSIFKSMRRILPINKQKMIWNAAAHNLASEVSKS